MLKSNVFISYYCSDSCSNNRFEKKWNSYLESNVNLECYLYKYRYRAMFKYRYICIYKSRCIYIYFINLAVSVYINLDV